MGAPLPLDRPTPSGSPSRNYFARHWYGDNSLPFAFFVHWVFLAGLIVWAAT